MRCIYWRSQADGVHGDCLHPVGPLDHCVLDHADECDLRDDAEEVYTCAVCGNIMSLKKYEAHGCMFCGAGSECAKLYGTRNSENGHEGR